MVSEVQNRFIGKSDELMPTKNVIRESLALINWQCGRELFGPVVKKKLAERADTIKAFNESLTKLDPPAKAEKDKASRHWNEYS